MIGVQTGPGADGLVDTFAISYPSKRYSSAWLGIVAHSVQSVFFAVLVTGPRAEVR